MYVHFYLRSGARLHFFFSDTAAKDQGRSSNNTDFVSVLYHTVLNTYPPTPWLQQLQRLPQIDSNPRIHLAGDCFNYHVIQIR